MAATDKRQLQSVISRRFMGRFAVQIAALTAAIALGTLLAYIILHQRIWYPEDPLYQILHFIDENYLYFFFGAWVAGMFVILFLQWRRIARNIITLADVIERMAAGADTNIALPGDLREIQDLLQKVQMETMRSRTMAAEAEQRKNDLVVYLAHDLKTPLTSVLGYLTLLRDEAEISPELRRKYLEIATGKAQRLEDLVNEFFEITRFSLKGLALEPGRLNFSRMLEQIASEFSPLFEPKGLSCTLDIEPDITLWADAGKLERVADNLLRNAVSYSSPGTDIVVQASTTGGWAELLVRNHGNTIPPHKLSHIFEQFYRVDAARSGGDGGAGLGLAIAKEIVELHGGHITAQSHDGIIEFRVQLPTGGVVQSTLPPAAPVAEITIEKPEKPV